MGRLKLRKENYIKLAPVPTLPSYNQPYIKKCKQDKVLNEICKIWLKKIGKQS